jgi:hypothetical protein
VIHDEKCHLETEECGREAQGHTDRRDKVGVSIKDDRVRMAETRAGRVKPMLRHLVKLSPTTTTITHILSNIKITFICNQRSATLARFRVASLDLGDICFSTSRKLFSLFNLLYCGSGLLAISAGSVRRATGADAGYIW